MKAEDRDKNGTPGKARIPSNLFEMVADFKKYNVPEEKYKRNVEWYLENKARQNGIPLQGQFELTPLCNLNCKMCYVHLDNSQFNRSNLLSVQVWKKLMQEAHNAGMIKVGLSGGECLTYPGFDELYLFLYDMGIRPVIMTNGLLLDQKRLSFFEKYPPRAFQITLYGSSDDAYEKVTGVRAFRIIYKNLLAAKNKGFRILITITPSSFMKEDIRPLIEKAASMGIKYNINSSLIIPRKNTGRQIMDFSLEDYMEIYHVQRELVQEELEPVDPQELPDENVTGSRRCGLTCGGGRSSFVIQYDGKLAPCASLYDISEDAIDLGFQEAWKRVNIRANNYPIPAECAGCIYQRYCIQCVAIHRNCGLEGHRDPRICERTKRLIQEGFIKMQR